MQFNFNYDEKIAVTEESGVPTVWSARRWSVPAPSRVFQDGKGRKCILFSDGGRRWEESKTSAPYCDYAQFWYGDFPYGSWCYAIRKCKTTGLVEVAKISTDINPRGESSADAWKRRCATYVPERVSVTA